MTSMEDISKLRAVKAAKIKLAILQATIDLVGHGSFKDLHISELCKRVAISKVTLFRYFPRKKDILLYYMRIWTFHRAVELNENGKKGIEGIFFIVDKLSESFEKRPGLILSFIGHLASTQLIQKPFPIKEAERKMLYPQVDHIKKVEILSLEQLLETFLLEAIFNNEITKSSNPKDLTYSIVSVIYGSLLTAHIHHIKPSKLYFQRNTQIVLNGLKY